MSKQQQQQQQQQKTKTMVVRLDLGIFKIGPKSVYLHIGGIPEDLPKEAEPTILQTAKVQFASQVLQSSTFLEVYPLGKTPKEEKPCFINLNLIEHIEVLDSMIVE